jgi:hypothetical protein
MERCTCIVPFHVDAALTLALIYFFVWIYVTESAYSARLPSAEETLQLPTGHIATSDCRWQSQVR